MIDPTLRARREEDMELIDVSERVGFSEKFVQRILRVRPDYKVPLICMEPGQEIPLHPSGTGIFYFMSGTGVMTVDGKETEVKAGCMVFVERGESRGIRATERLTAFALHMG